MTVWVSTAEVWRPPPGSLRGGTPLFNFSFDLQEFPQLQTEKSLLDFTHQSVQQLCDHVCMTVNALCIEGSCLEATPQIYLSLVTVALKVGPHV